MSDIDKRTLRIERTFDAPIELVWEAWTKAEHILNWWGPKGMEIKVIHHDLKPGGKWKYVMPMPDGSQFISEGEFLVVKKPNKIISTANFLPMTENVELHVSFEKKGDQTNLIFSVVHESEEYCKQQEEMGFYNGWGSALDRLSEVINSNK